MKKLDHKQVKKLKKHWKELKSLQNDFYRKVGIVENAMQGELGIDDLEFIYHDGYCGIGNLSRTIELIHREELEIK